MSALRQTSTESGVLGEDRDGELAAELARRLVQFHKDAHGRGPTAAKATLGEDVAVVVLRGVLTRVERTLAEAGHRREVIEVRLRAAEVTRERRAALVSELLDSPVLAATTGFDLDRDLLVETFVLGLGLD